MRIVLILQKISKVRLDNNISICYICGKMKPNDSAKVTTMREANVIN